MYKFQLMTGFITIRFCKRTTSRCERFIDTVFVNAGDGLL